MQSASILIKPASANCNIDCSYCFYRCLSSNRDQFSKGFMREETLEKLIYRAFEYVDQSITFAFQGGEPTLAGLDFYRDVIRLQKKYNQKGLQVENTIQTNGILLDEEWALFLREHHFLVGLSLDGPKKLHDSCRKDAKGQPTFEKTMAAARLLDKYHVPYNILTVITENASKRASYLYKFYQRNQFHFLQFIPCMDEPERQQGQTGRKVVTDQKGRSDHAVSPEGYGQFLCEMFDLWYEDFQKTMSGMSREEPTDIRMFSNLAQMAAGFPPEECGMNGCCSVYFVAEGDGSIYPCDFYCMDEYKLGTVDDSFQEMASSERALSFVRESAVPHKKCNVCPYFYLCRGGCKRWRERDGIGAIGLNKLCPAYEKFFAYAEKRILELGEYIRRKYPEYFI